jgi:hypothetical protein
MTSCAALLLIVMAANAQDILAGGPVVGESFICTFFNAGSAAVTLDNVQIRDEDGRRDPSQAGTCDDTLAPRKSCFTAAEFGGPPFFGTCRATVAPAKTNVRGVLFGLASGEYVSTDLR